MNLSNAIYQAKSYIPSSAPVENFITMNPLWDKTERPMKELIRELRQIIPIRGTLSIADYHEQYHQGKIKKTDLDEAIRLCLSSSHNSEIANSLVEFMLTPENQRKLESLSEPDISLDINLDTNPIDLIRKALVEWCSAFFDLGQAPWTMPSKSDHFFEAWCELMSLKSKKWKSIIKSLPIKSNEAIETLITRIDLAKDKQEHYFIKILYEVKGWAGFIKWLEQNPRNNITQKCAKLEDLIAIWLAYEVYLNNKDPVFNEKQIFLPNVLPHDMNIFDLHWIWQTAWEKAYQNNLINKIKGSKQKNRALRDQAEYQAVFCIDTRSEGLRFHLESLNHCETFSFAGFFGYPFQLRDKETGKQKAQSPPIINPETVIETIGPEKNVASYFNALLSKVKSQGFAAYGLFELLGAWLSLKLLGKTLFPSLYHRFYAKKTAETCCIKGGISDDPLHGFTIENGANSALGFLKTMGLTTHFSPIVLICGHAATTENNPYQSSFDCGACGGNGGAANAVIACRVLNNREIRAKLAENGIHIPKTTRFIAASHHTTIDKVELLLEEGDEKKLGHYLEPIKKDLEIACNKLLDDRYQHLPGRRNAEIRSVDWAELIPELGLANNAAIIVGPRKLTRGLNLNIRAFLHSYEPSLDEDGKWLESILAAPVVIAHWINSQYYFSTTDPDLYGAGNKAIHNVVGKIGVMEGNLGDIKIGLPIQSVYFQNKLLHEPLKLCVIIYAKRQVVEGILEKLPQVKNLFDGQWAYLHIIEPTE